MPPTINSTVYNDLHHVVQVFGRTRLWTGAAMDGAASRGNLRALPRLREHRTECCSGAAFLGAATNNHLQALQWLYENYQATTNPVVEVVAGGAPGHTRVVQYLQSYVMAYNILTDVTEAGAAHRYVAVLEVLRPWPPMTDVALLKAASAGHASVVQQILSRGVEQPFAGVALVEAAVAGHAAVVGAIIEDEGACCGINGALVEAARRGHTDVVAMLLARGNPSEEDVAGAFIRRPSTCPRLRWIICSSLHSDAHGGVSISDGMRALKRTAEVESGDDYTGEPDGRRRKRRSDGGGSE